MTTLREAAQQALEALEIGYDSAQAEATQYHAAMAGYRPERHAAMDADVEKIAKTIISLKAALAQEEQEPVVLHRELIEIHSDGTETWKETPLYTAPPRREWQSLSEEEIGAIDKSLPRGMLLAAGKKEFARAIEAKLKEKNNG